MRKGCCLFLLTIFAITVFAQKTFTITRQVLEDKIKGGWAGQTIGVTFGGPVEFRFCGTMIGDNQPLTWNDTLLKHNMTRNWGLYDDVYMDLTFVNVMEQYGLDAPVDSFASTYANAGYMLWHANLAGRYNVLHGIKTPATGHWLNNPHADDIDYQIESDFAGLMSPAMPQAAAAISDKIGHIMNYGDGWYGGVYVSTMYSLAFASSDINYIVTEALKAIPAQSDFYRCIHDVIDWHKKYPADWKQTWFEIQRTWSDEVGCPEGVFHPFNIDAKINAAYVVLGLLYGNGDFTKTMEITARCGQDADCNPSTAGGILGCIFGYDKIPAYWKQGLSTIEDIDFAYTTMSLKKTYAVSVKHALQNIQRNGGKVDGDKISIPVQAIKEVKYEKSFEGHYPVSSFEVNKTLSKTGDEISFEFTGNGYVLNGSSAMSDHKDRSDPFELEAEVYIDGKLKEKALFPVSYNQRRMDLLLYAYQLPEGKHTVRIKLINEKAGESIRATRCIVYAAKPVSNKY